jgi:uncharacterized membrane-anchored protein YitT (DUF2179 family)
MTKKNITILKFFEKYILILIGSFITAIALKFFLIPNNIVDGGIVGISIILNYVTHIPLGVYLILLNLPFLLFGYKQIGKSFLANSLFAIVCLALWVSVLNPKTPVITDLLLASIFGGIILGTGVGIIIRHGGSLDGTEVIAIVINKKTIFSVGQTIMFFNVFILSSAAYVFGWELALYSMITFFVAFKVIDIIIDGLDESKAAFIITDYPEEIAESIHNKLGRGVTFLEGQGSYHKKCKLIAYTVITRLEIAGLKSIISDIDKNAFVTIYDVSDMMGGRNYNSDTTNQ